MNLKACLFALLFFFPIASHAADSDALTLSIGGKDSTFTLGELRKQLKPVTVTLDDPVYGKKKSFDGFPLNDVLALGGLKPGDAGDEIVFTAKDGYAPNTSFAMLKAHPAVLTFQEHGTQKQFGHVKQGKAMISPAPYYVVWTEGKALENDVPWPYQLVKIEVVNFAQRYVKIFPKDAPGVVQKGFATFKNQCLRCHSLNLEGGDIGPELNVPKNITEYWDKKTLRAFIQDVGSFRARDKMPTFKHLKDEELDGVLEYLSYMKDHKQGG